MELFDYVQQLKKNRKRAVLITVIDTQGSTPRKAGAKMLVLSDGQIQGSIGGGRVEHSLIQLAGEVLQTEQPRIQKFQLTSELAMCCGGQMTFFMEPIVPHPPLLVFGCGHVGAAIIEAAKPLQFEIIAIDDLEDNLTQQKLPAAHQRVASYEPEDLKNLPFGPDAFIVIATREHSIDQTLLEFCLKQEFKYLGVIGSTRKAIMQQERLKAKHYSDELIQRVHCPIGLTIGALTPGEIAISVCAQLVAHHRTVNQD